MRAKLAGFLCGGVRTAFLLESGEQARLHLLVHCYSPNATCEWLFVLQVARNGSNRAKQTQHAPNEECADVGNHSRDKELI